MAGVHQSSSDMQPLFIATEKFDPTDGDRWTGYYDWAKIPQLTEVVSLDAMLCRHLIREFITEDWQYIVNENYRLDYFYNLDYLLTRINGALRRNVLGLYRNPDCHITTAPDKGDFLFVGYDLIEEKTQISALTNCGGFPEVFPNTELNHCGLITDFKRASEIKILLRSKFPNEPHADCELYAIWRLNEPTEDGILKKVTSR